MSTLSKYIRSIMAQSQAAWAAAKMTRDEQDSGDLVALLLSKAEVMVTGEPPHRMATFRDDHVIGRAIRTHGRFEESDILDVLEFTGRAPGRTTFLDVGANIGTHALFSLRNGFDRAVCIEPDPDNFMLLRINQILNGFDAQCININAAASFESGEMLLELSEANFGDHRIRTIQDEGDNRFGESSRHLHAVKAAPLDTLIAKAAIAPETIGLTWIDTQGHEGQVLAGAKCLTDANVPIVLEFWPYGLKRAGGYGLLRAFLSDQDTVLDIGKPLIGQESLSLGELDRNFDEWARLDSKEVYCHTDLLVLPKQR